MTGLKVNTETKEVGNFFRRSCFKKRFRDVVVVVVVVVGVVIVAVVVVVVIVDPSRFRRLVRIPDLPTV